MAVTTETEERETASESGEGSWQGEESPRDEESRRGDEAHSPEASERSEESDESGESDQAEAAHKPSHLLRKVAGGIAAFLFLAVYFVWIGSEMGAHAVSGSTEMWAIFGAIFLGVLALVAGGAAMRRND